MSHQVQKICEPVMLGEGPHWDDRVKALYFVSIQDRTIHKYVPATATHTKTKLDGRVGFIVPLESATDQFVVGVERKFQVIQWDGAEGSAARVVRELAEVERGKRTRINDGKCDPRGRLFAGTMGHEEPPGTFERNEGSLYRLDGGSGGAQVSARAVAEGVSISNGLAWDLERKRFYYTDSLEENIRRYDYDVETGEISNPKFIFDFKENDIEGVPDGSTIDTEGNLWVAVFGGSCLLKIDPSGKLLQKIPIPAKQVTSATWGGSNYETLFVTTAKINIDGEQKPPCGATFMLTGLGARGAPNVNFKL